MNAIKTPSYSHLSDEDFNHIYPPSEDTFLFIDALEKDLQHIRELGPSVCLEIGVGSGVVITALGSVLGKSCRYVGTDINPVACAKAKETGIANGIDLETYCCDLALGIPDSVRGRVDVLLFNPPYVPTDTEESAADPLELTWAGGKDGREVIDRLLPELSSILSPAGVIYFIVEKSNDPAELTQTMARLGYSGQCVIERKVPAERLLVMKFKKSID